MTRVASAPAKVRALVERPSFVSDLSAAYAKLGSERDWFAEGAFEGNPLIGLAGREKGCKSWAMLQLAVETIAGGKWLGRFALRRPGPVFYVDGEYGPHEIARRLARIARGEGRKPESIIAGFEHVWAPGFRLEPGTEDEPNAIASELLRYAHERSPALLVIDPFRNFVAGDENSAGDVLDALAGASIFRDRLQCPVVLVHHLNKAGSMTGSRAFRTRCDVIIEGTDDEEPTFSTIGRTLRRADPINRRFSIEVTHEHDEDDARARTMVRARFEGDDSKATTLSKGAVRVRSVLGKSAKPMTIRAVRNALNMNHPQATRLLEELRGAGIAVCDREGWSLATASFFEALAPKPEDDDQGAERTF